MQSRIFCRMRCTCCTVRGTIESPLVYKGIAFLSVSEAGRCGRTRLAFLRVVFNDQRHLVVKPDNRHAEEGDGVIDAKNVFVVDINVENFAERADIASAQVTVARRSEAVKTGAAPSRPRGLEPEGAIGVGDGPEVNIGAAIARKGDLYARIWFAGNFHRGVQPGIDHRAGRFEPAKPAGVDEAVRLGLDQLNNHTAHSFGYFQRRDRKIQLVHAAADEFHEKPQEKPPAQRYFRPNFEMVLRGMLVKMPDRGMNPVGIKAGATQRVEIGDEAGVARSYDLEMFVAGNALVNARSDWPSLPESAG
jgi:hypothetical protein